MNDKGAKLVLRSVSKRYGNVQALHPTDLEIERGEFFSLIGPSGSGKTTLLGTVAGFTPPSQGEIEVDGRDMARLPPYRREVGMVFQNYALFPHLTVFENVAFPLRLRKMSDADVRRQVQAMLETVQLPDMGDRMPSQLSGGQQQRIALARAAVYGPRILLMDEPLGALDKNLREDMQLEIKAFHARIGATVLYVTHDQDEAAAMSDRIAIMRDGRIVQHGTPRDLYEHPRNSFVACFLGSANLFDVVKAKGGSGDLVEVETPVGPMRAVKPSTGVAEAGMVLCVRPESILIEKAGAEWQAPGNGENSIEGVVSDAVYTAGTFRYQVEAGDGLQLSVRLSSVRQLEMLRTGDRVVLRWPAQATLIIPEE